MTNQALIKQLEVIYNLATEQWLIQNNEENAELNDQLLIGLGKIAALAETTIRKYETGKALKKQ